VEKGFEGFQATGGSADADNMSMIALMEPPMIAVMEPV
jgi:hypothetical protein